MNWLTRRNRHVAAWQIQMLLAALDGDANITGISIEIQSATGERLSYIASPLHPTMPPIRLLFRDDPELAEDYRRMVDTMVTNVTPPECPHTMEQP